MQDLSSQHYNKNIEVQLIILVRSDQKLNYAS